MRLLRGALVAVVLLSAGLAFAFTTIEFKDPTGDDKGPGTYTYPTHAVYKRGSFDLTGVKIEDAGNDVKITVNVNSTIEDPWDSKAWQGKGWSIQMIQIYVDTDHKPKSGFEHALPGINVRFAEESFWEKVIIISPQPDSRIQSEVSGKAGAMKAGVVLPRKVTARGKSFTALVSKKDLGDPQPGWGWQVFAQSNEGYPDKADLLTRKVNEFNGEHRFGGGSDYDCDPHVMDLIVEPAQGTAAEVEAQSKALAYTCDPAKPESNDGQARVPMVYR